MKQSSVPSIKVTLQSRLFFHECRMKQSHFTWFNTQYTSVDEDELLPVEYWRLPASWLGRDPGSSQSDPRRWIPWPVLSYALCGRISRCSGVKENLYKAISAEDRTLGTMSHILSQAESTNVQHNVSNKNNLFQKSRHPVLSDNQVPLLVLLNQ